jgi:hypothetical protein
MNQAYRVLQSIQMVKQIDIKVFISSRESTCDACREDLGKSAWISFTKEKTALCLSCADLDHLEFLPSGDAALTRRARKHSGLSAVVLKWARARKRYERQGILVESTAIRLAEEECLADEDVRARRRIRAAQRRTEQDHKYIKQFSDAILEFFPKCPSVTARSIADHACQKYSGRIGRSAIAKTLDIKAVRLAVIAHVRHVETQYDELLMRGWDRNDARGAVVEQVNSVIAKWQDKSPD